MRYFCEGAGPCPGLQDRTKGETNTTDFIKAVGPPCWGGGETAEMRRLTLRNGFYGLPELQTQETLCSEFQTEINWFFVVKFLLSDIWWLVKISNYQGGSQLISILVVNTGLSGVTNVVSKAQNWIITDIWGPEKIINLKTKLRSDRASQQLNYNLSSWQPRVTPGPSQDFKKNIFHLCSAWQIQPFS